MAKHAEASKVSATTEADVYFLSILAAEAVPAAEAIVSSFRKITSVDLHFQTLM